MRKQAEGLTKEYDRLMHEHTKLQVRGEGSGVANICSEVGGSQEGPGWHLHEATVVSGWTIPKLQKPVLSLASTGSSLSWCLAPGRAVVFVF